MKTNSKALNERLYNNLKIKHFDYMPKLFPLITVFLPMNSLSKKSLP